MSAFYQDFCEALCQLANSRVPVGGIARLVVKNVPSWLILELNVHLAGEPVTLKSGVVLPLILVDDNFSHSLVDPTNPKSGIYNLDRVTEIRNHCDRSWIAICAAGNELNASNQDTTDDFGEVLEHVYSRTLNRIFPSDSKLQTDLIKLWKKTIAKNQPQEIKGDTELGWGLAKAVAECGSGGSSLSDVIASLGHVKCDGARIAMKDHLKILENVAEQAESEGLGPFFKKLTSSAADIDGFEDEVVEALGECRKHLQSTVVDAASWRSRPNVGYRPNAAAETLPKWWHVLDLDTWLLLLSGMGSSPDKVSRQLKLVGETTISNSKPWTLVEDSAAAYIQVLENGEVVEASWTASKDSGSFEEIPECTSQVRIADICDDFEGELKIKAQVDETILNSKRIFVIGQHELKVFADVVGAFSVSAPKRSETDEVVYESQVELSQQGTYSCVLYVADTFDVTKVIGRDITPDTEGVETPINFSRGRGNSTNKVFFQLESDESCTYEVFVSRSSCPGVECRLLLEVSAGEETLLASGSEFGALLASHMDRKLAGRNVTVSRNDKSVFSRLGGWLLDEEESWYPASLVAGHELPKYSSEGWRRSTPLNADGFERDIRPEGHISPPGELLAARSALRESIRESVFEHGGVIEATRLWELAENPEFSENLSQYCNEYERWLDKDELATWFDTVTIHLPSKRAFDNAAMEPSVLLLTPLHPLLLRWQVDMQVLLARSRSEGDFCSFASELDPDNCPPYWELKHAEDQFQFVSTHGLSKYWSVMVSSSDLMPDPADSSKFDRIGLSLPSPTRTLVSSQARGMLTEVRDLLPAVSNLKVSLRGSVNASDRLFDGIVDWYSDQILSAEYSASTTESVQDWLSALPMELDIFDQTDGSAAPSSAPLASVAESANGKLRWFEVGTSPAPDLRSDLVMHTSLNVVRQKLKQGGIGTVSTPGLEMSLAPIWLSGRGRVQTPISVWPSPEGNFAHRVAGNVTQTGFFMETFFKDKQFKSDAHLEGFPATGMDPAMIAHLLDDGDSYVWRYSRDGIGDDGYFVIARSDTTIEDNMRAHLASLEPNVEFDAESLRDILSEFGKRGLDSLHAAAGGGVAAAGAIGTLVTSRLLQPFSKGDGIFPDNGPNADVLNFLVPLDPFRQLLSAIAKSLNFKSVSRPDFLAISVATGSGVGPLKIKLTPVEAKCFTATMTTNERRRALDQQCRAFSAFLHKVVEPDANSEEGEILWSLGRRKFLSELIVSGVHIRTHSIDGGWDTDEGKVQATNLCSRLMTWNPEVEIDPFGRLVVVDASTATCFVHLDTSVDNEGFQETLQVSRSESARILANEVGFETEVPGKSWNLNVRNVGLNTDAPAGAPRSEEEPKEHETEAPTESDLDNKVDVDEEISTDESPAEHQVAGESEVSSGAGSKLIARLGVDSTGLPIDWEPFKSGSRLPNGHCVIVGQSGSGKTYTIERIMAPQAIKCGAKIFALEFNDEFEGSKILEQDGAVRIDAAQGMQFNPLVVPQSAESGYLNITSHVYAFADVLDSTFSLGVQQVSKLRKAIKSLYERHGIDMVPNFDPACVTNWPEFEELRETVEEVPGSGQLLGRIEVLFDTAIFRGREGVMTDLLQNNTVVGLKNMPGVKVQHAVSALLLRGVYSSLSTLGTTNDRIRNVIIVDEAHKVANSPPVETLIKEIRKFGGAVWLSSQEPTDFHDSVWANCATFICLRVEDVNQARLCSQKLDNNYELVESLRELKVGSGYIRNNHYLPFRRIGIVK